MCLVSLCILRLTNIGFVQCFSLGSLVSLFACVSRFVMHTSPHKHRVCAVLFSRFPFKKFLRLCLSRFVMPTLPHKHRVCECFSLGFPFLKRLYSFPHKHRVCVVPFPRPPVKFVRLSMPSQTGSFDNEIRQPKLRCFETVFCRHLSCVTFRRI